MIESQAEFRLSLRSLSLPQRLLVVVILATVGIGYLAALANMFAQVAGADGAQTIQLGDIPTVYRERGISGVFKEIDRSLGKEDVVRRYHGHGAGVTRLEAALNGSMKAMIVEGMSSKDEPADEATLAAAENLRQALILWSHLPHPARRLAYDEGIAATGDGAPDLERLHRSFFEQSANKKDGTKREALISATLNDHCVKCHSPSGPEALARSFPLETFEQVDAYCVEDRGMSYAQLAMTTHVHLLGFSVLFAMTGFLFSLTSFPLWVRVVITPWVLGWQMVEIFCWWLAKSDPIFAEAIFYLGPLVGVGLLIQISGSLFDMVWPRS